MIEGPRLLSRIYRLKLIVVAIGLVFAGVLVSLLADWMTAHSANHLVVALTNNLSDVFVVTGGFGIAIDFFTGREKEEAETARVRSVLRALIPDFTDAVIQGFEVRPEDLRRVATPESLDVIATNALALRLGDTAFAREIYMELRDQSIRAAERWYDVDVSVRLSPAPPARAGVPPLFDILIQWEYTTVPSHAVRKFACVSDRDEFYDLVTDVPATSVWFVPERTGVQASDRSTFELLSFAVDGEPLTIRRSARRSGQTYSVNLPTASLGGEQVRLRSVYRTVGRQDAHRLFIEVPVPARDLSLELDYTGTAIAHLSVTDTVTSLNKPQVTQMPEQLPGRRVQVELPGWVLPRSGFAFVWTLSSEESASTTPGDSTAA